ncbi:glutamate receptor ionotropic, delta-2-like [Penaeus japonicus]|uniref:glutamate receptor ionotropic, delta-2-like n=1 Tax=Penaeus japonicus TaxID=27405 RepID=UPI001C710644|nr:glutamate receptor ionotropic, delta-2-like [Penaeus japonicus]
MRAKSVLRHIVLISLLVAYVSARFRRSATEFPSDVGRAISALLDTASRPTCSVILFADRANSTCGMEKIIHQVNPPWGVGMFHSPFHETEMQQNPSPFLQVVEQARKIRKASRCVSVVVISKSEKVLSAFAESSLLGRLLVWETRLLLVTQLGSAVLDSLVHEHWNFAMMNTAALNLEEHKGKRSEHYYHNIIIVTGYTYICRTAKGDLEWSLWARGRRAMGSLWGNAGQFFRINMPNFLIPPLNLNLHYSFYSARVNVTALPWPPNWEEETVTSRPGGAKVTRYSGTDYFAMETLAHALNFSINLIPTNDFVEVSVVIVTDKVEERTALITGLTYAIIPKRLERHDFILAYDFFYTTFSMANPSLESRWQNLFLPLSLQVWAAVASSLLVVSVIVRLMHHPKENEAANTGTAFQELFKILLGQDFSQRYARTFAGRLVLAAWLVFALVIGSAYRGNLTASLTLPVNPSRPETLQDIVEVADGIVMPPYGEDWKRSLLASDYELYRRLGELLHIVPSSDKALQLANEQNSAAVANRRYLNYIIAGNFTDASGSSKLYVGKDNFYITPAGFPIPHDAPYKPKFQKYIFAFAEQGLYVKWHKDMIAEARGRSLRKQRAEKEEEEREKKEEEVSKALTITHMQGPFLILALGWASAVLAAALEGILARAAGFGQ